MSADDPRHEIVAKRLRDALPAEGAQGERLRSVVTESVPSRLPGHLLVWTAGVAPEPTESDEIVDAAVALEFACLHQYLHAIPRCDGDLRPPALGSAYGEDPIAAILDGDLLLARAFALLPAAGRVRSRADDCYRHLSRGSIECYEHAVGRDDEVPAPVLPPLSGVAVRIGGALGGVEGSRLEDAERAARTLGHVVPGRMPVGEGRSLPARSVLESRVADLARTVTDSSQSLQRLEQLVVDAVPEEVEL